MIIRRGSGQIALVLVLVMTVMASVVVALSARTTVETRVQEVNVDSSGAMLAAEAGLEQALKNAPTSSLTGTLDANTSFTATDQQLSSGQTVYQGIKRGDGVEITTTGSTATSINLVWQPVGSDPTFTDRAIFVTVTSTTGALSDHAFDTTGTNGFTLAGGSIIPGFAYSANVIITNSTSVDVTVLGGDVDLGFSPVGGTVVSQLRQKQVVGTVTRGVGGSSEIVKYGIDYRQSINDQVPEVFRYAVFSGQSISQ